MNPLAAPVAVVGLLLAQAPPASPVVHRFDGRTVTARQIDAEAGRVLTVSKTPGLAVAIIDGGAVVFLRTYGRRDEELDLPLTADTVLYGASLTKAAFAFLVMQLVDEGLVSLDTPIERILKKPLPEFEPYRDLASDPRWRRLTPRILLDHSSGFPNFRFLNADGKLDFKFEPGTRYAYSGEGMNLLQFVLEEGLGLDVGAEMQRRVFQRFGMKRTGMTWQDDFADNASTGYDSKGKAEPHHRRRSVRAAGSMDTTVADYAAFLAGFVRGEGLSAKSRDEMLRPQIAISSAHQFPTLEDAAPSGNAARGIASGLGWILFRGPYGPAFYKGGHDDWTDNHAMCLVAQRRCILLMTNSGVGARLFPEFVRSTLGDPGTPWAWEYNPLRPLSPTAN